MSDHAVKTLCGLVDEAIQPIDAREARKRADLATCRAGQREH